MLDDVLVVFPPDRDVGATSSLRRLVEVSVPIARHLTGLAFRQRAVPVQDGSIAERERFATQQGVHEEVLQATTALFAECAQHAERGFRILVDDQPRDFADLIAVHCRPYPLTVFSFGRDLRADFEILSMVLYVAGRPVLAAPAAVYSGKVQLKRATVAWNGTLQAARALDCASRAFGPGIHIDIVSVQSPTNPPASLPKESVRALVARGLLINEVLLSARDEDIVQEITRFVLRSESDLLLIGAPSRGSQMDFNVDSIGSQILRLSRTPVLVSS